MKLERPELWLFCLLCVGPFLIYRFCRRPDRRIDWAAMLFLKQAIQKTSQKTRLLEIAQVTLQTLAVGLVVLAVLLPVWKTAENNHANTSPAAADSQTPDSQTPDSQAYDLQTSVPSADQSDPPLELPATGCQRCVIYVVDDSGSMNALLQSPRLAVSEPLARFELLRRAILQELDQQEMRTPADAILVVPAVAQTSELVIAGNSAVERAKIKTFVSQLEPTLEMADWEGVCQKLERLVRTLSPQCETLEIRIFSDFQWGETEQTNEENGADSEKQGRASRAISESLKRLSQSAQICVVPIFQQVQNLAITRFVPRQTPVLVGENAELEVTLTNYTAQDVEHQLVELFTLSQGTTQKKSVAQQWVKIPAHGTLQVAFNCRFTENTPQVLEVALGDGGLVSDGFRADDSRQLCIQPKTQAKFLLVESWNEDFSKTLASGSDFLEAALKGIFSQRLDSQTEAVKVERATDTTLAAWNLAEFDGILINDVCQFDEAEAQGLVDYVQNGGALLYFTGRQTIERLTRGTVPEVLRELFPGLPQQWCEATEAANAFRLDVQDYQHPWLATFRAFAPTGLETLPATAYAKCTTRADAQTVLVFTNGDPWILTRSHGNGTVVQFTYPADTQQNTFPLSPMFIPLMERLIGHATERSGNEPALKGTSSNPAEYELEQTPVPFARWQEIFAPNLKIQREDIFQILDGRTAQRDSLVPALVLLAAGLVLIEGLLQFLRQRPRSKTEVPR